MAGIYIHIPFCRKACHYCNFHFSTSLRYRNEMIAAILQEIVLQKDYLAHEPLQSIYFGGGTPSVLSPEELDRIIDQIDQYHEIDVNAEITIEANPDDLKKGYLAAIARTAINRLSIGIQSFNDEELAFYNRSHNSRQAIAALDNAMEYGFEDISVDLIFGSPLLEKEQWLKNMSMIADRKIPHISCYGLTIEPKTALEHFIKIGKVDYPDEEKAAEHFLMAQEFLTSHGYEQYEISNYSLPGRYARHNTSYWKDAKYLGIGPSAHSYNKHSRQWNINNNMKYIRMIGGENIPAEVEVLNKEQRVNELLMLGLRTKWGVDLARFDTDLSEYLPEIMRSAEPYISQKKLFIENNIMLLAPSGKIIADRLISDLFV